MAVKKIGHIGVAAENGEGLVSFFTENLGGRLISRENVPDQKLVSSMVQFGNCCLEIMETTDPNGVIGKFVSKKGGGLHHISFQVDHLAELVAELEEKGANFVDKALDGKLKYAFINPRSAGGVLVELVEFSETA